MKEHYDTLGLQYGASHDDIKRAFRALAHKCHPDKQGGDADMFKKINTAYQELLKKPVMTEDIVYQAPGFSATVNRRMVYYNGRWYFKI